MQAGDSITEAVAPIMTSGRIGRRVLVEPGGVRPRRGRDLNGRCLTIGLREEIEYCALFQGDRHGDRQVGLQGFPGATPHHQGGIRLPGHPVSGI
jgi:hypothetical protein